MNERIRELSDIAYKNHLARNPHSSYGRRSDYDREFAELIVRECIAQLEIGKRCDPYTGELFVCERNDDIDYEIAVLKNHFGVDE